MLLARIVRITTDDGLKPEHTHYTDQVLRKVFAYAILMKNFALLAVSCLAFPLLATAAHAQVYSQTRAYNFINTFPLGADGDRPIDTADNADGSRYFLGQMDFGGSALAYLAKISPLGEATWITTLNGNGSTYAGAIASDAAGNVYISLIDADGGYVVSYAASTSMRWSTAHDPNRNLDDLVATSDGVYGAGSIGNLPAMEGFSAADGSSLGVKAFGTDPGNFYSIKKNSKGCYYACGDNSPSFLPRPMIAFWDPAHDFTDVTPFSLDDDGYGQLKEICIDPVTDTAVANGFYQPGSEGFPHSYMPTLHCDYDGTTLSKVSGGIYQTAPEGGVGYSIAANESGIYGAGFTDFPSGDYKLSTTKTTIDPLTLLPTRVWEDIVSDDNATFSPIDVTFSADGNPLIYAASTKKFTIDGETFAGVHLFQYGQDGARISRVRLGSLNQRVRGYFSDFGNDLASNIGTTGMAFWSNLRGKTSLSVTKFVEGPDETYKGSSTGDYSLTSRLGVLRNEPNYFDLSPITADLVPGSAEGLGSLSLDPSGAFTATAAPGFGGYASFKYHAMQGAVDLGERTATLKIRPTNTPTAMDDEYTVAKNAAKTFLFVPANDTDPHSATLHITSVTSSANASISISGDRRSVAFKPNHGFAGDVLFQYTVTNPRGGTATATVTVHVGP